MVEKSKNSFCYNIARKNIISTKTINNNTTKNMTTTEIIQSLDNCIEIAKASENKYIENRLTEIANSLMNDSVKHAKQVLKEAGYYTDNLWQVQDVLEYHYCTDKRAQEILNNVLSSGYIIEEINTQIKNEGGIY